jgi:predicted amidohydrolase
MRKLGGATEKDSYRVLIEICEDLMNGMSYDEVMNKPYRYQCEMFYYTNLENVPENDPHWSVIKIAKLPAKT